MVLWPLEYYECVIFWVIRTRFCRLFVELKINDVKSVVKFYAVANISHIYHWDILDFIYLTPLIRVLDLPPEFCTLIWCRKLEWWIYKVVEKVWYVQTFRHNARMWRTKGEIGIIPISISCICIGLCTIKSKKIYGHNGRHDMWSAQKEYAAQTTFSSKDNVFIKLLHDYMANCLSVLVQFEPELYRDLDLSRK